MDTRTISINGLNVEYTVRRSKRAKYPRIQLDLREGVTIILPHLFPEKGIPGIFESNEEWLHKNIAVFEAKRDSIPERRYISGESYPYLGEMFPLDISQNKDGNIKIALNDDKLSVYLPDSVSPDPKLIRNYLEKWYRFRARREIEPRVRDMAADMDVTYNRIAIRDQKTRWGSCSAKGNLNFNYKLVMAPPEILEYIILHELTHLFELKHTPLFRALVESRDPDYKDKEKWLRSNGYKLVL